MEPKKFRPLSIASVIIRHLHKILARRSEVLGPRDERPRAFTDADEIADNIFILSSTLDDAQLRKKQIHAGTLVIKKAFDTVHHSLLAKILLGRSLATLYIEYMMNLYGKSKTKLRVNDALSDRIEPGQGIR